MRSLVPAALLLATAPAQAQVAPTPPAPSKVMPAPADPYGFGPWLNATRARAGLAPLAHDPGLSGLAAANSSRGFAHHGFNPGRENVGMGTLAQVCAAWMGSPAHSSAILDPRIRSYGIALVNGVWTFNGR